MFEEIETLPIATVFFFDIEIRILNVVRRRFQLNITTGTEVNVFAFGQTQCQFFNEGRHVRVGFNRALPALHAKELGFHLDLHVLLNRHLARQTPAGLGLTLGEGRGFSREDVTAALFYNTTALGT